MRTTDQLAIVDVARRAGLATSALRYYERQRLISSVQTSGGIRRYPHSVLRRPMNRASSDT